MDQKLSDLYTSGKLKKWKGEKNDGAIWPNTIFGIVKNEKVYRGKITNAWAGVDKEDVDDKRRLEIKTKINCLENLITF